MTDVDENHFGFYGCMLLSLLASATQCEGVLVTGIGVLLAGNGPYLCSWNYVNPDLDREIIQR